MHMIFAQPAYAALRVQIAAALASALARSLALFGLGLMMVGALIALSALIGAAMAFGLCGAVLAGSAALFIAAQPQRPTAEARQSPAPPIAAPLAPSAAGEIAFVLGFVAIRRLLAQIDARR
jgi:hypothetical protein